MRIGILKTGRPPPTLDPAFGTYPDMFQRLLDAEAYGYTTFAADEGRLPGAPEDCDAYIVTGSSAGVYEAHAWIPPLLDFLRGAAGRAKLVGVCFGHQALAKAFGGEVIKSPKGWGVGEQTYRVLSHQPWMDEVGAIRLPGSHQDQVVAPPPGADIIAASDFTPIGALAWREHPTISIQLHPEFTPAYARALIEARRGAIYTDAQADAALATYDTPDDRARVGRWIRNFLEA